MSFFCAALTILAKRSSESLCTDTLDAIYQVQTLGAIQTRSRDAFVDICKRMTMEYSRLKRSFIMFNS